ncbi:hypothetical protein HY251_07685, partial [bacterium]|nr:hypothetical protein [bacterium]
PWLARAASPREALFHVLRALEGTEGDLAAIPDVALEHACLLAGLGGAPAEALVAHPEDLARLAEPSLALDESAGLSVDERLRSLRDARRRHTLAVAGAELSGRLSTSEAARALSDAADLLLDAALRAARETARARAGDLALTLPFAVLALGKLGGRELNYSSDVDLVFLRGDDAPAEAADAIARALVRSLEDTEHGGRLYRADLRLRPEGASGALAPRLASALAYYERTRRTWERQALVKARAACGDRALGETFLRSLAPWVFETPLGARGIDEILSLRARQETRVEGDGSLPEIDIKEGPGGIRDVEYCVQFLQLLHGGKDPSLRATGTLEAISRLEAALVVRKAEADALRVSYGFLRKTEHALQLTKDRELKKVPADPQARSLLARALGLDLAAFDRRLSSERAIARATLDSLLRKPFARTSPPPRVGEAASPRAEPADEDAARERARAIRDIVLSPSRDAEAAALLRALGFRDPDAAARDLEALAGERSPYLAPSGRARTLLAGLAPRLLSALSRAPDPDSALRNLERSTATLGAKATFYELLLEDEGALELFVSLAAASDFLVETLARRPGVFDEVVDRLLTGERPTREAIRSEVSAALERAGADPSRAAEALRDVRAVHLLLLGIRDVSGRANVQNTARDLALLAEAVLEALLSRARKAIEARHGSAPSSQGRPVALATLALGKLGGRELSYSSDLDLLFVIEGQGESGDGTPAELFFEEVAREVMRLSQGDASAEGPLYPIDLRLRPAGARGRLAVTLDAARRYYAGAGPGEHAAHWERLALQKLRPIAGDLAFGERAASLLGDELYGRSYGKELREAVVSMRAKQIEAASSDDLKRAPGGLADIEFLASALALEHGKALPSLREANTARLLTALGDAALLPAAEHLELLTAYQHLRSVELRIRVAATRPESRLPRDPKERRGLALRLGYVDAGGQMAEQHLEGELLYHRSRVRPGLTVGRSRALLRLPGGRKPWRAREGRRRWGSCGRWRREGSSR